MIFLILCLGMEIKQVAIDPEVSFTDNHPMRQNAQELSEDELCEDDIAWIHRWQNGILPRLR